MMNLEKLSASILYENVLDGVDLEYIAYSMNIKDNIFLLYTAESGLEPFQEAYQELVLLF